MVEEDHPRQTSTRDIKKLQRQNGSNPCPNSDCEGVMYNLPNIIAGTARATTSGYSCQQCSYAILSNGNVPSFVPDSARP